MNDIDQIVESIIEAAIEEALIETLRKSAKHNAADTKRLDWLMKNVLDHQGLLNLTTRDAIDAAMKQ